MRGNEIQLISDGKGLAVIGNATDVERFVVDQGLSSKVLDRAQLTPILSRASASAQAGSQIAEDSGRWVKLTKESAEAVRKFGLTPTKTPGVDHAMIGKPGEIKQWIQVVKTPGTALANPALLSGAAGVMSQLAMQQAMEEITDYLARIDEKLDDLIRSQMNQVLARMDGVDLAVREAMTVRATVGRVSEVTWSKVQNTSITIMETQAYALRQLADYAEKLEKKTKVGDIAEVTKVAEAEVRKWLGILARCCQLHDAVAVLELDRVLDADPDELDRHRLGLDAARDERLVAFANTTRRLLVQMKAAIDTANAKVLLNPINSPSIVRGGSNVIAGVLEFHDGLGIEGEMDATAARRWREAAGEHLNKARDVGTDGLGAVKDFGVGTFGHAKAAKGKLTLRLADRKTRRDGPSDDEANTAG